MWHHCGTIVAPCGTGVPPVVPVWHRLLAGGSFCGTGLQPVFVVALRPGGPVAYTVRYARQTLVEKSTAR